MKNKLIGEEVSLHEMLDCRERRANVQNNFLKKYNKTLISFCMNIPGPVKTNEEIRKVFEDSVSEIYKYLEENNIKVLDSVEFHEKTGDEIILAVDEEAEKIKESMIFIEENHPLGRLFDIDVLNSSGEKMSRENFRKCFICNKNAQDCASQRTHSVEEMQEFIDREIKNYLKK